MRFYRLSFLFFYSTKVITNLLYINNGDIMRKKFRSKKKINLKIFYIPIMFIIILIFTYISCFIRQYISNEIIINNVFKLNNNFIYEEIDNNNIINKVVNSLKDNIFNSPVNLLKNQLKYNGNKNEIVSFVYKESLIPQIYIYNSHQGESYSKEYLEDYNITPDVLMASKMLKNKLEDIGINSIVEENNILEYMKKNNLNHAGSYKASRYFLTKIINQYPNIKLYIDLHRDASTHTVSTTIINDKPCAKILFVIGLEYSTYEQNLNIVQELNNIILEKYPSLTRGIMKKKGPGVNGVYNQDLASNVILIEIGGNENNIEEVNNTLDLLSIVIGEYLNEKN